MAERGNVKDLEFKWGLKMGDDCLEKETQFYESFTYDGTQYTLYDSVYMCMKGEPEPYIGKLIGIWETVDKTKEVNVQWFFRPSEILKWLGDQTPMQKEIFLASGEGIGLSNVNALEAIAGKCYVVCTSEDSRNRQPSEEETRLADYIFYRTFDVGLCTILDKMGDSVGGLEVKYVFNREESKNVTSQQTYGSSKVEVVSNTVACKGKIKPLIPNSYDELELLETGGHHDKSVGIKDVKCVSAKSGRLPGESSDYKSGNNSNLLVVTNKQTQACASGQRVKSSDINTTMDGVIKVTDNKQRAEEKLSSDVLQDKPAKKARICNSTKNLSKRVTQMESGKLKQKVAQRSNVDKGNWYSSIDIIDDAFQTNCVAIRISRTRISSPHSGEALIMLANCETTEGVYRKLSEGCLMLPNGRPLVATAAPPMNSEERQRAYFGHLVIDSIKLQGDARDAVSTSHCSQPNTIEYAMAMEWCLLQTQFDGCWKGLYKLHKEDMRRLKRKLKSK